LSELAVSIIVAAYNVAPYIAQCLDSVVVQTLNEIEIIVINDGSTDETLASVNTYQSRFPATLRVISQINCGLSAVRNRGIAEARGKYVGFVDGDDWVAHDMYLELFTAAEEHEADLVIGNGVLVDHTTGQTRPFRDRGIWQQLNEKRAQLFDPAQHPDIFLLDTQACKRLYKREFLRQRDFRFAEGFIFEDVPTHYELLCNTNRLRLVDEPFYYYRVGHPGRITYRTDQQLLQIIEIMLWVESTLQNFGAEPEVWANFIWYQDWVLRWLGGQIEERFAQVFARGACGIARRFPALGLEMFRDKFRSDEQSQTGVRVQISGCEDAYYMLLRGSTQPSFPG
jgi:glycosyltransferase involved in cell wall biosynthesis